MEEIIQKYIDEFGEMPPLPKMVNYTLVEGLIREAIIRKTPLDQDEIFEAIKGLPIDVVR